MRKIKKLGVTAVSVMLLVGLLTGCGESMSEEGTDANTPLQIEDIREGVYVMSNDGKFYYPNTEGQSFSGETTSSDPDRIVWSKNDSKYIPTLYADDRLVYFTTGQIPETIGVEKFADAGYTFGLSGLSQATNGNYVFTADSLIPGSTLEGSFNGFLSDSDTASIVSVGGKNLIQSNITDAGTVRCKKGDKQILAFMKGTFYSEVEAIADEHIWYSCETGTIPDYELTKNGFIILTVPASYNDGDYFSVMGTGLIRKSDKNRPVERKEK